MIRWKYLLPRLILIAALLLALTTLSNPLSRLAIVHSLQSTTGAKVDIGLVDVNALAGAVNLTDVQIADPQNPLRNLVQASQIELDLDSTAAMQRRLVVERARIKHLQFGTPRIEIGQLPKSKPQEPGLLDATVDFAGDKIKQLGESWAQQIEARLPVMIQDNLETVKLTNELRRRWPSEFQKHRNMTAELRQRVRDLKGRFQSRTDNPLRDLRLFREALFEAKQLSLQSQELQRDIRKLTTQLDADRKAIVAAHGRDRKKILDVATNLSVRSDQLNELLLSEQQNQIVSEVSLWLQRFRGVIPALKQDLRPERSRGVIVPFRQHPQFVCQNLGISGEALLGGRRVQFEGDIQNLTEAPKLSPQPVTFDIRGKGDLRMVATGTIDRRGPRSVDSINFRCPSIPVPRHLLGNQETLLVEMKPSLMHLSVNARVVDDKLEGTITVRHSNVSMNIASLHSDVGGNIVAEQLTRELANVDSFQMDIGLTGTLQNPEAKMSSPLGDHFATVLQGAFESTIRTAATQKTRQLDQVLNQQLGDLQRFFDANSRELLRELSEEIEIVASLQKLTQPGQLKLPRLR